MEISDLLADDKNSKPYYRVKSPSQTDEDIEKQIKTKEIWGAKSRNFNRSHIPKVKAYTEWRWGKDTIGIVFWTDVAPDVGCIPGKPTWSGPREGVKVEDGYAKIKVTKIEKFFMSD